MVVMDWNTLVLPIKLLQTAFPDSQQLLYDFGIVTAQVVTYLGFVLLIVNSVPFGLDQMPDASAKQIAAFVHWYGWSVVAGAVTDELMNMVLLCMHSLNSNAQVLLSLLSVAILSVPLCSLFLFRHWLIIEPSTVNPLKTVFSVLKFSAHHKHPVRRSAFTYCEDRRPSRIDMAKAKFGGPFTNEEVEDVKTCMRMVLVIASISAAVLVILASISSVSQMLKAEFTYSYPNHLCQDQIVQVGLLVGLCIILCLPIYKATLDIFNRKCFSTSLKRVGSAQVMVACASLILLVLTTAWYVSNAPSVCMFVSSGSSQFPVDHRWIEIPLKLILFSSAFFLTTAMLEFVCAQAPYNLRGLLIGTLYSVGLLSAILGLVIFRVWYHQNGNTYGASCGVWYYLFVTATITLGLVVFSVVAKWYKNREREPPDMYRVFVEAYYDHYCGR